MAASNLLEKLDKALLRPGRFDRQVFVPPPDMRGREQILERPHRATSRSRQDVDLERVARHTAGLTGADLANLATRRRSSPAATSATSSPRPTSTTPSSGSSPACSRAR